MGIGRRQGMLLAALASVPVVVLIVLLTFDWNQIRPWLGARVSNALERPVALRGRLDLLWMRPALSMPPQTRRWHDQLPRPWLVARDVVIGNPATMPPGQFASVKQLTFTLEPMGLLRRQIRIPLLRLDAPHLVLQRLDAKRNNWQFPVSTQPGRWQLELERIVLADGKIVLDDAVTQAKLTAQLRTLDHDPTYGIAFSIDGSYRGASARGQGRLGAVLSLRQQLAPYPVEGEFVSGKTRIQVEGTVTRPAQLAALDLQLTLAGASMARLYDFTGIVLPETPAFTTSGRLRAELDQQHGRWIYDGFAGKVGASDIGGRLSYTTGAQRPQLSGTVRSRKLVFADLAPIIGADSNASKQARGVAASQPRDRVLPAEQFRPQRWNALDADVQFTAENIIREKALPISQLSTHLVLKDGALVLDPLNFGMAGGAVRSRIELDAGQRRGQGAIAAKARVELRQIQIRQLFPHVQEMQASAGHLNGRAQLSAHGNSIAAMLASANGELSALADQGTVSKMLLEKAGLNLANIVITQLFGDKQVRLNCIAADLTVKDGVARTRHFVIDTEEAVIQVAGAVNLASEQVDLRIDPHTRTLRILSLRSPLYLRGPLRKPDISLDKAALSAKAGAALTLGALAAPLAALLPLINTGPGDSNGCTRVASQANANGAQAAARPRATGARADGRADRPQD